jgi:hypothetical protein
MKVFQDFFLLDFALGSKVMHVIYLYLQAEWREKAWDRG